MVDYYKILDVAMTATVDEIKVAIKDKRRLWMQKTNAPQLERRQEAEVKVKQIDEAEKTLLDSSKRADYDRQLKTSSTKDERTVDDSALKDTENLVKQGWDLLINDRIADAIYVATKATEKDGANSEAWALLAQAKYRWGEIEDSIYEYKKAIKLKPNEPDYYYELGGVYESEQRWQECVDNYLKASKISPNVTMYRASIGQVYLRLEMYNDAIPILESCVKEEPNNETYSWFLAMAYNDLCVKNHMDQTSSGSCYITTEQGANNCIRYFKAALALKFNDSEMRNLISKNLEGAEWALKKHWGRPIGQTIKWSIILGVAFIIACAIKVPIIIIGVLIGIGLFVLLGFSSGFKINSRSVRAQNEFDRIANR